MIRVSGATHPCNSQNSHSEHHIPSFLSENTSSIEITCLSPLQTKYGVSCPIICFNRTNWPPTPPRFHSWQPLRSIPMENVSKLENLSQLVERMRERRSTCNKAICVLSRGFQLVVRGFISLFEGESVFGGWLGWSCGVGLGRER